MLTTLRRLLTFAAIHGQCRANQTPVYVEQVLEGQVESSNVGLCKEAFQDLKI